MSRFPIRVRLTLGFAAAMAIVLAVVGLFVYQRVGSELLGTVDQTLAAQAAEELDAHKIDADTSGGTTLVEMFGNGGKLLYSHPRGLPPLADANLLGDALFVNRLYVTERVSHHPGNWRVLLQRTPGRGAYHWPVVAVARSLEPRAESLDHLSHQLFLFLPLALLAACLGGYGLAAGALRPVEHLRRRAEAVTPGEPASLPVPPARDEVARLATTLNDMLARLHNAFEHERRFVSDASHELRTPLALLRTELDLALRRPRTREELESALRSAAEETQRLSRLADDLLLIARADRGTLPVRHERLDVDELMTDIQSRFGSRAASLGVELRVAPSQLHVDADPLRVGQALVNLVDNALTHGRGPVVLSATNVDGMIELHVRDSGNGFPDDFAARAFDRFSRADEARGRGGTGLGLSIVELVATAHGGSAGLRNMPGGGADVWLSLPYRTRQQHDPAPSPQGIREGAGPGWPRPT